MGETTFYFSTLILVPFIYAFLTHCVASKYHILKLNNNFDVDVDIEKLKDAVWKENSYLSFLPTIDKKKGTTDYLNNPIFGCSEPGESSKGKSEMLYLNNGKSYMVVS